MERLNFSLSSLVVNRPSSRRTYRQLRREQEEAAAEVLSAPGKDDSLSGYVPSTLIPTEKRVMALAVGGAPAWSRRLRRIDTLTDAARTDLEHAWHRLAFQRGMQPARFAVAWREYAASYDFSTVNDLIRRHNLYFPAEANLAMSPQTGDFIGMGGGDYRLRPLDDAWVLSRFPPDFEAARSSSPTS